MPRRRTADNAPAASSKRPKTAASLNELAIDSEAFKKLFRSLRCSAVSVSGSLQVSYVETRDYDIKLQGPSKTDKLVQNIENAGDFDKLKLPDRGANPYRFTPTYNDYNEEYGPNPMVQGKDGMGGDAFDITSWISARRKKYAFNNKDPLGKKEIDFIKQGLVIQMV